MEDVFEKTVAEATKEVAREAYNDIGKPIAKPTGQLVGLIPRAVKAAFAPLEKWILQREYSVAETMKLLEQKLENVTPDLIESPEPHIAVPAIQYISYCMDNDELRNMYANLLANSMNKVVKNGVHPGFVEIIKQLCPDEAKILKYMKNNTSIPTVTLRYTHNDGSGIDVIKDFSNIGELANCEEPLNIQSYIDNFVRLGLLERASALSSISDKSHYEPLKNHPIIISNTDEKLIQMLGYNKSQIDESYVELTAFGKQFCKICLDEPV